MKTFFAFRLKQIVLGGMVALLILAVLPGSMIATAETISGCVSIGLPQGESGSLLDDFPTAQIDRAGPLIHVPEVRTKYPTVTGAGYTVAVLDSGVDYTHPALAGRYRGGYDFVNNDSNPDDDQGHGTHVTGIIASNDASYPGIAPQVGYAGVKVLDSAGNGDWLNIKHGLQWVIDNRVAYNIVSVNMSFATSTTYNSRVLSVISDELSTLRNAGVFIAAASGNGWYGHSPTQGVAYPAADQNVVSVGDVWTADFGPRAWSSGAIDYTTGPDRVVSHCDRSASMLDVMAPGALITSTAYNWEGSNPDFVTMGGTSMASPMVAGLATLIRQAIEQTWAPEDLPTGAAWQDTILQVMQESGTMVYDGDDENDNVANLNAYLPRIDALAAIDAVYVPEPSSLVLLSGGIAGLAVWGWRRGRRP